MEDARKVCDLPLRSITSNWDRKRLISDFHPIVLSIHKLKVSSRLPFPISVTSTANYSTPMSSILSLFVFSHHPKPAKPHRTSVLTLSGRCQALSFCWFDFSSGGRASMLCKSLFVLYFFCSLFYFLFWWAQCGGKEFLLRFEKQTRYARLADWKLFAREKCFFVNGCWREPRTIRWIKMNLPFKLTLISPLSLSPPINIRNRSKATISL